MSLSNCLAKTRRFLDPEDYAQIKAAYDQAIAAGVDPKQAEQQAVLPVLQDLLNTRADIVAQIEDAIGPEAMAMLQPAPEIEEAANAPIEEMPLADATPATPEETAAAEVDPAVMALQEANALYDSGLPAASWPTNALIAGQQVGLVRIDSEGTPRRGFRDVPETAVAADDAMTDYKRRGLAELARNAAGAMRPARFGETHADGDPVAIRALIDGLNLLPDETLKAEYSGVARLAKARNREQIISKVATGLMARELAAQDEDFKLSTKARDLIDQTVEDAFSNRPIAATVQAVAVEETINQVIDEVRRVAKHFDGDAIAILRDQGEDGLAQIISQLPVEEIEGLAALTQMPGGMEKVVGDAIRAAAMRAKKQSGVHAPEKTIDEIVNDVKPEPTILGQVETVEILGLPGIKAKVDTGAETSSLHATDIRKVGRNSVQFTTTTDSGESRTLTAEIAGKSTVKSSNGKSKDRYVIVTTAKFAGVEVPIKVNLSDRSSMQYKMLLGRSAFQPGMLVNPRATPPPAVDRAIDPKSINTVEDVSALLVRNGIDPALYGNGEAKSLASLLKEIKKGEAQLFERDGKLVRVVQSLALNVYVERDGKRFKLYEDRQEFRDGRSRRRQIEASLGEKLEPGESPQDSIGRALKEELGISDFTQTSEIVSSESELPSPSYPGIYGNYTTHTASIEINPLDWKVEYREEQAEKVNIMGWFPIVDGDDRGPNIPGSVANLERREKAARERMAEADYASSSAMTVMDTSKVEGFWTDEWKSARRYNIPDGGGTKEIGFDEAVDYLFNKAVAKAEKAGGVAKENKAYIIIGFGGAGKSTLANPIGEQRKAVHSSADDAKLIIPEFEGGDNSGGVHEESSRLGKVVLRRLVAEGYNVVIEKLGSSEQSISKPMRRLAEKGYHTTLLYVDVPKAVAMERAITRFELERRAIAVGTYDLNINSVFTTFKDTEGINYGRFKWNEPNGWDWAEVNARELEGLVITDRFSGRRIEIRSNGSAGNDALGGPDRRQELDQYGTGGSPGGIGSPASEVTTSPVTPGFSVSDDLSVSRTPASIIDGRIANTKRKVSSITRKHAIALETIGTDGKLFFDLKPKLAKLLKNDLAAIAELYGVSPKDIKRNRDETPKPTKAAIIELIEAQSIARSEREVDAAALSGEKAIVTRDQEDHASDRRRAERDNRLRQGSRALSDGGVPESLLADAEGRDAGGPSPGDGGGSGGTVSADRPGDQDEGDRGLSDAVPGEGDATGADGAEGQRGGDAGNYSSEAIRAEVAKVEADRKARRDANYRISESDQIGVGGAKAKIRANIDAIRIVKTLAEENRKATPDEKKKLVKYVGWGAFAQSMFKNTDATLAKERQQLTDLLTAQEYESASASTLNAHYTSSDVIGGMWAAMDHLGFTGGRAIEPAVGVGHFIGLQPAKGAANTDWVAVELDTVSGAITKALYEGSDVRVQGFETVNFPDNFFDLAISNVPFGNFTLADRKYSKLLIHDYFFAKSIDKVRPGGIVAFITSSGTMDKADYTARKLMAEKADLVGAIRLPGGNKGAFASNAGTEVTTDILFLRKPLPGEDRSKAPKWIDTVEIKTPEGPTNINEYFAKNPSMMLGKMRLTGSMYRDKSPVLIGSTDNLGARIVEAAKQMPANVFSSKTSATEKIDAPVELSADGVKEGALFLKGGKLFQNVLGQAVPQKGVGKDLTRIRALLDMRDILNDIYAGRGRGKDGSSAVLRNKLNKIYDAFVKKFGPINKTIINVSSKTGKDGEVKETIRKSYPNLKGFAGDPDAMKLAAIESYDEETGKAAKAAVFSEDVITEYKRPTITGPIDALSVSLNETGRIDIASIAGMLDVTEAEAVAALGDRVYLNPNGESYELAELYLSGDVVSKLDEARAAAETNTAYQRNVKALEEAQPIPLTRMDISVSFAPPWLPANIINEYIAKVIGIRGGEVKYEINSSKWIWIKPPYSSPAANASYGASDGTGRMRKSASDLVLAALNDKAEVIFDEDSDGKKILNAEATADAAAKLKLIQETFSGDPKAGIEGWIWEDDGRAVMLENLYNHALNRIVRTQYDGSHLELPGLAPTLTLPSGKVVPLDRSPHRRNAIWRAITTGNLLIDHAVGSGKTITGIAAVMEMKRLGMIQRPMAVVPNHMLEQFAREWLQAYPTAKLLVADAKSMEAKNRKAFAARIASDKWDGIIIRHSSFGRLGMKSEAYQEFIREQKDELLTAWIEAKRNAGERADIAEFEAIGTEGESKKIRRGQDPTVKEIERRKKQLETKLAKLMATENKDDGTTFEEIGVDFLLVDEAHAFKNLDYSSRHANVKGIGVKGSQRATDLFIKMRHIEKSRPGRSAIFMTATPMSRSIAEIFTMQRYLQMPTLKEYGLDKFDNWAATFGRIDSKVELAPNGSDMKETTSFSRFSNVPELQALYSRVTDSMTVEQLNLNRPALKNGTPTVVEAHLTSDERKEMDAIVKKIEALKGPAIKGQDNHLSLFTRMKMLAVDARLIFPEAPFNPNGKVAKLVENVSRIYKDGKAPALGQLVFLDMGVPGTKGKAKAAPALEDIGAIDENQIDKVRQKLADQDEDDGDVETEVDGDAAAVEAMQSGKFNLYQDIKDRLIANGVPAKEIAFIHDAKSDTAKAALFKSVRDGKIRVLLGTRAKMGVGANVQRYLIAVHHPDAPYNPADVEQADGRILRQGNENKVIEIYRYITAKTPDSYLWQILQKKADSAGQFRAGARGQREMEDIDSPLPEAATIKALATGDPRIMRHAELVKEVRELEAGKRGHERGFQNARRDLANLNIRLAKDEKLLAGVSQDASKVKDTSGDNFEMRLDLPELSGAIKERKKAGIAIRSYILSAARNLWGSRTEDIDLGAISGFPVSAKVKRTDQGYQATLSLNGNEQYWTWEKIITPESDPVGIVRQIENLLDQVKVRQGNLQASIPAIKANISDLEKKAVATPFARAVQLAASKAELESLERDLQGKGPKPIDMPLPMTPSEYGEFNGNEDRYSFIAAIEANADDYIKGEMAANDDGEEMSSLVGSEMDAGEAMPGDDGAPFVGAKEALYQADMRAHKLRTAILRELKNGQDGIAGAGVGADRQGGITAEGQPGTENADLGSASRAPIGQRLKDRAFRARAIESFLSPELRREAVEARANAQGFTMTGYHGTRAGEIDIPNPFMKGLDFGFHVGLGSPKAANSRIGYASTFAEKLDNFLIRVFGGPSYDVPQDDGAIIPVKIRVSNPLRLPDVGVMGGDAMWSDPIAMAGVLSHPNSTAPEVLKRWLKNWIASNGASTEGRRRVIKDSHIFSRALSAELDRLGYDAIIYKNLSEGYGQDSLFVWDASRVRSAFDLFHDDAAGAEGLSASDAYVEQDLKGRIAELMREDGIDDGQEVYSFEELSSLVDSDGVRRNAEGFELALPFKDTWGDPRFNPDDRVAALTALQQIQGIDVRNAAWGDLVQARRDLNEIAASIMYYQPSMSVEDMRAGDEVWLHLTEKETDSRPSIFNSNNDDRAEVGQFAHEGRKAIEHLLSAKRAGVYDLMRYNWTDEPKTRADRVQPDRIGDKMPSGFYFSSGRKLADVPDALFQQGGNAVINWLRQSGVKKAEIDHLQLYKKVGGDTPTTRADFAKAIAERVFDFRRKTSWLNPERSTGNYDTNGTRVFTGPRIPGRGVYFEQLMAFPKTLKGGEQFLPGSFESPHWNNELKGAWSSWRGSIRDLPNYGKTIVGEEGQSDFMQGVTSDRRPRISSKDAKEYHAEAKAYGKVIDKSTELAREAVGYWLPTNEVTDFLAALSPGWRHSEHPLDVWQSGIAALKARTSKGFNDGTVDGRMIVNQDRALKALIKLRSENEKFFEPGAYERYGDNALAKRTPETPLDDTYVRTMVRDLLLAAAKNKAQAIAIATSETTNRIQANTYNSAAHFYDGQLRPSLEKELRRLTGRHVVLEKITLPKAMGAPKNEKPYTVWATKLDPDLMSRISANGLPIMSLVDSQRGNLRLTPDAQEKAPAVMAELKARLTRMLPSDVAVNFADRLFSKQGQEQYGRFRPDLKVIDVALRYGSQKAFETGAHEIVHVLRDAGAFTDAEWAALVDRAKKLGAEDGLLGPSLTARYRRAYEAQANDAKMPPDLAKRYVERRIEEEMVARLAELHFGPRQAKFGVLIDGLMQRLSDILDAIIAAFNGKDLTTPEATFRRMEQGKIAKRVEPKPQAEPVEVSKADKDDVAAVADLWPELSGSAPMGDGPAPTHRRFEMPGYDATVKTSTKADGNRTRTYSIAKDGKSVASMALVESEPDQWGIIGLRLDKKIQGKGVSKKLTEAIEADIGRPLKTDGIITAETYRRMAAQDPASVRFHVRGGASLDGLYIPSASVEMMRNAADAAAAAVSGEDVSDAPKSASDLKALEGRIPDLKFDVDRTAQEMSALAPRKGPPPAHLPKFGGGSNTDLVEPSKGLSDLVEMVNEALGMETRQGRLSPGLKAQMGRLGYKLYGQFSRKTGVTRIAIPNDLPTLVHEGGHKLEIHPDLAPAVEAIKQTFAAELTPLATPGKDQLSEGWAEWFALFIIDPQTANQKAPNTSKSFRQMLEQTAPELLVALEAVQAGHAALVAASPGGVVLSRTKTSVQPTTAIGERVAEVKEKGWRGAISDWFYSAVKSTTDDKHPLKVARDFLLTEARRNLGNKITDKDVVFMKAINDPYKMGRMMEHARVHATAKLRNGIVFQGRTLPSGPSMQDVLATAFGGSDKKAWNETAHQKFGAYLISRRMNAEWDRFDLGYLEGPPDNLMPRQAWAKAQNDFEKAHPEFKKAATKLDVFVGDTLLWKREQGFLTDEQYLDYSSRDGYAPLNRIMDDKGPSSLNSSGSANKRQLMFRFKGSTRDFINPIESIIADVYAMQTRVELNNLITALIKAAEAAGPSGGRIAERIPAHDMKAKELNLKSTMDMLKEESEKILQKAINGGAIDIWDASNIQDELDVLFDGNAAQTLFSATATSERGERIAYFWEDGKRIPVLLGSDQLGEDIFNIMAGVGTPITTEPWFDGAVLFTQTFRAGVTKSPAYIVVNWFRDQLATWALSRDFTPFWTGLKGFGDIASGSDAAKMYENFAGMMGGIDSNIVDTMGRGRDALQLRKSGYLAAPTTWQSIMRAMEVSEAASRIGHMKAAYDRLLNSGFSEEEAAFEAAYIAHDVMDFSRHGSKMVLAARLVAFMNAQLQGLSAALRTARGERDSYVNVRDVVTPYLKAADGIPLSIGEKEALPTSTKMWFRLASIGMIGLALALLYEDDPEYEELTKSNMGHTHWFFKIGGKWWRAPKPFELAIFSNLFEAMFSKIRQGDPLAAERFMRSVRETAFLSPEMQTFGALKEIVGLVSAPLDKLTGPLQYGAKPDDSLPMRLKGLPPEMQWDAYTSEFSKMMAATFGASPYKIDNFIRTVAASVGRDLLTASDYVLPRINQATGGNIPGVADKPRADKSFEDTIFLSRITRRAPRGAYSTTNFWREMSMDNGRFTTAAKGYKRYMDELRSPRDAQRLLSSLDDERKAYVMLEYNYKEADQDMHPLNRAKQVIGAMSGIRRQMAEDNFYVEKSTKKGREPVKIELPPSTQRVINEIMEDLALAEARNAQILMGKPGWEGRPEIPTGPMIEELKAIAPDVAEEYQYRITNGRNKTYSYNGVKAVWPDVRQQLLSDDPSASLAAYRSLARQAE